MKEFIKIRGAAEHNLKNVNLDIPRNEFVVFTGLSGSGKSSLAFDTIYAEGQRRYMESLSSYARQFLGQMEKPKVESIEGLSPAISIDQKSTNHNPRSTVGTVTEIYDHLRLMYARIGIPHCPQCKREIHRQSIDEMVDLLESLPEGTRIQLLAPVVRGRKGTHEKLLEQARKNGYVRAMIDGQAMDLGDDIALEKNKKHDISVVVDRLVIKPGIQQRLTDSLETVCKLTGGLVLVDFVRIAEADAAASCAYHDGDTLMLSQNFACPECGISIDEIEPRSFSFNNPYGACPECSGLGSRSDFSLDLMIPDRSLSLNEGAIQVIGWQSSGKKDSYAHAMLEALAKKYEFSLDVPYGQLPEKARDVIENGTGDEVVEIHYISRFGRGKSSHEAPFEGLLENTRRRYREAFTGEKSSYENYMTSELCPLCKGQRLKASSLAVTIGKENIHQMTSHSIGELCERFDRLELNAFQAKVGEAVLKEIRARIHFLKDVGLEYLTLARAASSLSGGEAQRIRLATQIGSGLVGVAYILDEPSIGLHQRDNAKLLETLLHLRDLGNTVIVVEHDEETMRAADFLVDIGPGAGEHGGRIVSAGSVQDAIDNPESVTGMYLSGKRQIPVPEKRREPKGWLTIRNAYENNLKHIDVRIPVGVFTCVTGVSGSGKSSLINEILYKSLEKRLNRGAVIPGKHDGIEGTEQLDKIICIDQSPIGRNPRSNPATYIGVFDLIRDLYATTPDARMRGYDKGRFSFNVKGGRCEACSGDGIIKIEMHFLPDVYVPCEVCHGKRYNRETLEVKYKEKSIYDCLNMTVEEAAEFFKPLPKIYRKIKCLQDVGLGYIRLGQPSTELSGGEAQRIKLAAELSRTSTGRTIYVLDEPTTGLHFEDVNKLNTILQTLTEEGNTIVVIEHNLDVIKAADYIIDMGPEGGDRGGTVIASGTPEEICKEKKSYTGRFLKPYLKLI